MTNTIFIIRESIALVDLSREIFNDWSNFSVGQRFDLSRIYLSLVNKFSRGNSFRSRVRSRESPWDHFISLSEIVQFISSRTNEGYAKCYAKLAIESLWKSRTTFRF